MNLQLFQEMLLTSQLYYLGVNDNSVLKSVEKQEKRASWTGKYLMLQEKEAILDRH